MKSVRKENKSELEFDLKYNLRKVKKYLEDKDNVRQEFMSLIFDKLASNENEGTKIMWQKEFYEFYNSLSLIKEKVLPELRKANDLRPDVIFLKELERNEQQELFDFSKFKSFCEAQSIEIYSDYEMKQALGFFLKWEMMKTIKVFYPGLLNRHLIKTLFKKTIPDKDEEYSSDSDVDQLEDRDDRFKMESHGHENDLKYLERVIFNLIFHR